MRIVVHGQEAFGKAVLEKLLERNRIFIDRMVGVGLMTPEDAVSYGLTGPLLRATGVKRDLRKDDPYMLYARFDFDVPVGTKGDNFDRFSVRFEEIRQSMRIVEQALRTLQAGPVDDGWRVSVKVSP